MFYRQTWTSLSASVPIQRLSIECLGTQVYKIATPGQLTLSGAQLVGGAAQLATVGCSAGMLGSRDRFLLTWVR
jgi:hypothetical protein